MKTILLLVLTFALTVHAQRHYTQSPPTVITPTKLAFSIDVSGDTGDDIVIVDRATGSFRIGIVDVTGQFVWSAARDTGMTSIDSGAAGHFINPTNWSLMLTSKAFNRAQPVLLDGSDLPDSLDLQSPEPQTLCALEPVSGGTTHFVVGYDAGGADGEALPKLGCFNKDAFPPRRWAVQMQPNPRDATPIFGLFPSQPSIGLLADSLNTTGSTFIVVKEVQETFSFGEVAGSVDALPADAKFTSGNFSYDQGPIGFGYPSSTVVIWSPMDSLLRTARVTSVDWDANALLPAGLSVLPKPTYNMGRPIKSVHVIETAGAVHLMIVWNDAAGGAGFYNFTGNSAPTLIEAVDFNGLDFEGAMPSANGTTVFLGTRNGQPAWDRMKWDGTHFTRFRTGTIPGAPTTALYSNIVAFSGEPFVNPAATELKRKRVRDWTTLASLIFGSANVTSLVDGGASAGLGNASVTGLTFSGNTSNLLVSRLDNASSIAFLANSTSFTNNLPHVTLTPAPGTYKGSVTLTMTAQNMSESDSIFYNLNNAGWTPFEPAYPPTITANSTIKAFVNKVVFFGPGGNGPITSGSYTITDTLPAVQKQPIIDANHNGLSDAWENLTGVTNPGADDDGDGFLNLQEQNAGTDPRNALDKPGALGTPIGLDLLRDSVPYASANTLRWSALDAAVVLEGSDDLQTWTVVTSGITQVGNENRFNMPTGTLARKFYRLRR